MIIRPRYARVEEADQTGIGASVLLSGTLNSQWSDVFSTEIEIDHVEDFLEDHHSDGVRFNGEPVILDVPGTEVNQAFVRYKADTWQVSLGRQRITFDNQRFISDVAMWQNDQTFDALAVEAELFSSSHFDYVYIANANRVFGDDAGRRLSPSDINFISQAGTRPLNLLGDHEMRSHLLHFQFNELDYQKIVLYSYYIHDLDFSEFSNHVNGLRYSVNYKHNAIKYFADLEAALQSRFEMENDTWIPYGLMEFGLGFGSLEISARWEQLDSDKSTAFITPLGSGHEFQGWADRFVNTPASGLKDQSLRFNWRLLPWRLDLRYHQFRSVAGGNYFGDEIDLDIIFNPAKRHEIALRLAKFKANSDLTGSTYSGNLTDVDRLYFTYTWHFK